MRPRDPMLREFEIFEHMTITGRADAEAVAHEVCALFTPGCRLDDVGSEELYVGRQALHEYCTLKLLAFPDFKIKPIEIFEDGNTAVMHLELSGTHSAPFWGVPASGRKITYREVAIYRCTPDNSLVDYETIAMDTAAVTKLMRG